MRSAVGLVDGMAASMLNFSEVGDPATILELESMTVQVKKESLEDVNNETVVTNQGSLDLPEIASLIDVEPGSCVQQTLVFASFNPQMWVESAAEVNSHTLRFNLESCDPDNDTDVSTGGARRRRRRSITDESGFMLGAFYWAHLNPLIETWPFIRPVFVFTRTSELVV